MSVEPLVRARVEPYYLHIPDDFDPDETDGDQVAGVCADAGFGPDEEQRLCLDLIFARRKPGGKSLAFEVNLKGARQNFKTAVEMQTVLGWLFLEGQDPVIWTGQEWKVIEQHFHKFDEIIGGYSWMSRQVRWIHRGSRDQALGLKNGAQLLFRTREPDGGTGLTAPKIVMDETWKVKESHISGLLPAMSALSITGDPQILYGSSAAHEESEVLHDLTRRGRGAATDRAMARKERRLIHVEYCAPPPEVTCDRGAKCTHDRDTARGCGMDKPQYWLMANPAMDRRISAEHIQSERRTMTPAKFGRERMGWDDPEPGESRVIPIAEWAGMIDLESETDGGEVSLAIVFSANRGRAAIGLAGWRGDGLWHVELADYRPGTNWTIKRALEICKKHDVVAVGISDHSHEESIAEDLERELNEAGESTEVVILTADQVAVSFATFFDAVMDDEAVPLRHRNQDDLTLALVGATTREIGDAGRAWARKKSDKDQGVDISPVVAVSEAMYVQSVKAPYGSGEPGGWVL